MLLISYIQQYFNTSITVLTNQVWKLLIALFKVPNTGALTVLNMDSITSTFNGQNKNKTDQWIKIIVDYDNSAPKKNFSEEHKAS